MLAEIGHVATMTGAVFRKLERTTSSPPEPDAVLIESVARGSGASLHGLRAGDIIVAANRKPVHSEKDLLRIAKRSGRTLVLDIVRGGGRIFVLLQ